MNEKKENKLSKISVSTANAFGLNEGIDQVAVFMCIYNRFNYKRCSS